MLLKGSAKQFAVDYVDAVKPVSIISGKPYEAIGGELSGVAAETTSAIISNDAITLCKLYHAAYAMSCCL